jgi:hypothetical protein
MTKNNEVSTGMWRRALGAVVPILLILAAVSAQSLARVTRPQDNQEKRTMATQSKFYCNIKALNPAERAEHKQLTDKLIAARKEIVETEKGYEFQFDPSTVSLAELARWVAAEGKCCPFFDFHIDLERAGSLLCLRLTGEDGIKPFIRTEFQVPAK